ncbi:MAG: hypothetical protein AB2814_08175, partial [Candidatus Sedimenticola endophacoides]
MSVFKTSLLLLLWGVAWRLPESARKGGRRGAAVRYSKPGQERRRSLTAFASLSMAVSDGKQRFYYTDELDPQKLL